MEKLVSSIIEKYQGAKNMSIAHTCHDSVTQTEPSAETVDDEQKLEEWTKRYSRVIILHTETVA